MAMGERTPVALISPAASARLAVAEVITNLAAAPIAKLSDIKLSANWMSAADHTGENQALYEAVHAVGMELCPALDLTIPVGKDSMSMRTAWQDENGEDKSITAPLSLVMTGFAPVTDAMRTLTPQLRRTLNGEAVETDLILIDLGHGAHHLHRVVLRSESSTRTVLLPFRPWSARARVISACTRNSTTMSSGSVRRHSASTAACHRL